MSYGLNDVADHYTNAQDARNQQLDNEVGRWLAFRVDVKERYRAQLTSAHWERSGEMAWVLDRIDEHLRSLGVDTDAIA